MSLINQIRSSRRSSEGLPFNVSLESFEGINKAIRTEDKDITREYNDAVSYWSGRRNIELRNSIARSIKRDVSLSSSIKDNVYYNRKGGKEAERVGFSFMREGIYVHKGAGRGQGGVIGSNWIDRHGRKKSRALESSGKMGSNNRMPNEWFDSVVNKKLPQLADIVGNYSATLQVNATSLFIDK